MQNFHHNAVCPVRDILSHLSSKWAMSQRMLTVSLRALEADGLVNRKVYPEVPPRVEYCLTERGDSLIPCIQGLVNWALTHMPQILEERKGREFL